MNNFKDTLTAEAIAVAEEAMIGWEDEPEVAAAQAIEAIRCHYTPNWSAYAAKLDSLLIFFGETQIDYDHDFYSDFVNGLTPEEAIKAIFE